MADKKENNEWDNRENKFKEENEKAPDFRVYKQKELGAPQESSKPKVEKEEEEDVDLI
jgi:uncharacterized protein (DUF736 family)